MCCRQLFMASPVKEENKKSVTLWGTGSPLREFLFVDDLARACIHINNLSHESLHTTYKKEMQFYKYW